MARKNKILNTVHTGLVTGFSDECRGIIKQDGKCYFVDGALEGEEVEFQALRARRGIVEAKLLTIKKASADRINPECSNFSICGGCSLQHMSTDSQIALKQKTLAKQLKHFGKVEPKNWLPPLQLNPFAYRRRARLGVRYVLKKEQLFLGFREKNARYLANITDCKVLEPKLNQLLNPLNELINSFSIRDSIAQVEASIGDNFTALVLRNLNPFNNEDLEKIINFAEIYKVKIYEQSKGIETIKLISAQPSENSLLNYSFPDHGITINFSPADFIQVNAGINKKLIDKVLSLLNLSGKEKVLDLFCGIGNISLPIAKYAKSVIGVEGLGQLTARAQENAKFNNINNAKFYVADLQTDIKDSLWFKEEYDYCVIDPPRSGAQEIIRQFKEKQFKTIVYVSCNPATLARDAGILVNEKGYKLIAAGVMDMFPHTTHIESIALFSTLAD